MRWLLTILGLDSGSGIPYLFWSGIGSDLAYIGALGVLFHHLNCHESGCWRPARHATNGYCTRHRKQTEGQ